MEDDDEFGDLYTDVLRPFTSLSSSAAPPLIQSSPAPQSLHRPIDLNNIQDDIDSTPYGDPKSIQTLDSSAATDPFVSNLEPLGKFGDEEAVCSRVSGSDDLQLEDNVLEEAKHDSGSDIDGARTQPSDGDEVMVEKEVTFDIEEVDDGIDDVGSEPVIPGLSNIMPIGDFGKDGDVGGDWESDSEDDLQIVLNDNDHGPMVMERGVMAADGDGDNDEDEDGLVIVADGDPNKLMEDQDWGEDAAKLADGERKETVESGKAGVGPAGMGAVPKISYSSHGYHPFHSQFKYVRPSAAPMLGSATSGPAGVPGQVRPLANTGPVVMAGRGRGEWRSPGLKNASQMQKNFHSGFGMPVWGSGRGFGGLEFTLPSHKTIFDVDVDSFEEKPWKYPGVDVSDFFNFGFNEESWKDYCKQLQQFRLESTMQSKIRVYESARTEQEYDPDLPPELAAATGINDVPAENADPGKTDAAHSDSLKGPTRLRPPLPTTGRAIQVEGGYGERLPSIETRQPRIRDSDAIIEIIPQGSLDNDTSAGNDAPDRSDTGSPREDSVGGNIAGEGVEKMESEVFDNVPQPYSSQEREPVGTRIPLPNSVCNEIPNGDEICSYSPEAPGLSAGSIEQSCLKSGGNSADALEERKTQQRLSDRFPQVTLRRSTKDKKRLDGQPEYSVESVDGKCSHMSSSHARESSFEHKDTDHDELVIADGSLGMEKDEMASTRIIAVENGEAKKKKLSSQVEEPIVQEPEREDSKAAISDDSRARSGSSKDYERLQDGVEGEVMQGHPTHMVGMMKRHLGEKEQGFQKKYHDGRQKLERSRVVMKGREDPYLYRESDTSSVSHLHVKSDGFERRKERNNPYEMWQHRDDDPYNRRIRNEESRKREHGDEVGSRYQGKVRESDRIDKDELYSRKQLDNGSYRVYHDKGVGGRHRERDDNHKGRCDHMDDYYCKRRKEEEYLWRDHLDKEEILLGPRDNITLQKRERDEVLDERKRGEQRFRENLGDHNSFRLKDEDWLYRERSDRHREKEEWQRLKKSHEENISKREREEGRTVARGGRNAEDKAWFGHAWTNDENKGSDKEYQYKRTVHHGEPSKRRNKAKDEGSHHGGGEDVNIHVNRASNEERRFRHERSSTHSSRVINTSDQQKVHEKKQDNTKRNRESEAGSISVPTKRNQDHSIQSNEMDNRWGSRQLEGGLGLKGTIDEQGNGEQSSRRTRDIASSDDELQDSRRGRSKLERWTSHKEIDNSMKCKSSSTAKIKESGRSNSGSLECSKALEEPPKPLENADTKQSFTREKDAADQEMNGAETKPSNDNKHLDTIEKLKKRSERFKPLPVPSEKDVMATKKLEPEPQPYAHNATPVESEIKPERPARKRRWISN